MRIFITDKATDLATLVKSLSRGARASDATLERVKALNPQLSDTTKLGVGEVLMLPETPELEASAGVPVGAESLDTLGSLLRTGLRDAESRTARGLEALVSDRGALRGALKGAAAKRLVEGDSELKKQVAAAETHFVEEQKRVAEVREQLKEAAKVIEAEFAGLQKLLG